MLMSVQQGVAKGNGAAGRRGWLGGSRGFALVVVIVVMLLASFLAAQLILLVKTELKISYNIKARVVGHFLAEAGLNLALFRLFDKPLEEVDLGDGEDYSVFFEGYEYYAYLPKGKVTYYAVNESGKIDLNRSSQRLVELFLEYHLGTESEEQIGIIVDSLLDWKDNDDLHRLNGAESETYMELDDPYIARNGKIEDPAEFFLINGTDLLANKFFADDVFTVHNPKGKINFNSVSPAMLDFLTGGDQGRMDAYREAKKEFNGKLTAALAAEIIGEERFGELQPYLTFSSANNSFFTLTGTGFADVEQEDDAMDQEMGKRSKRPGTRNSLLIQKKGSEFTSLAWQERYK